MPSKSTVIKLILTALVVMAISFSYFYYQMHSVVVNKVNINNMNFDNSTNYRYMFREEIEGEKHRKEVEDRKEFK